MDLVSEILGAVRLRGGVFIHAEMTAPWSVSAVISPDDCLAFMPRPGNVIAYHVVIEGGMVVAVEGAPAFSIGPGEAVLFPRSDSHVLSSADGVVTPMPAVELLRPVGTVGAMRIVHGGGGERTTFICGFLAGETNREPFFAALPRVMVVGLRSDEARAWVEASVRFAAAELVAGRLADSPGMTQLSETLLIEAVRDWCLTTGAAEVAWLRAARDPQIGRALALIHGQPTARWTVARLAAEAAMSRTAFIRRFTALMGQAPIAYATALRLQAAKAMLRDGRSTIASIAYSLSFGSEAAFSRAFKRSVGTAPSVWRQTR